VSSPVADTTTSVDAPADLTVLMAGDQAEPTREREGRRTWTSREPVARDVRVAVGASTDAESDVDGVRGTTACWPVPAGTRRGWPRVTAAAIEALTVRSGPFPRATRTALWLPHLDGGIEHPSSVLLAGADEQALVHEVAPVWFPGMVGDDQFRDPWLDESSAGCAESVTRSPPAAQVARARTVDGSMAGFPDDRAHVETAHVETAHGEGAAMLLTARERVGAASDAVLRCHVDAAARTIASPADVAAAPADLPAALAVLQASGAPDAEELPG